MPTRCWTPTSWLARICVTAAIGFVSTHVAAESSCPIEPRRGLQVLYEFDDRKGLVVHDRSGIAEPLDLKIENRGSVRWKRDSLVLERQARIRSVKPAERLTEAIRESGEITIEGWMRPENLEQDGPARIITLSQNSGARNVTLGQDGKRFDARFRTTQTGTNGTPSLQSRAGTVKTELLHVVYTRTRQGKAELFVDGEPRGEKKVGGDVESWDESFRLALGDELSGGRAWRGELHRIAIYNRALTEAEIRESYDRGPNGPISTEEQPQADRKKMTRKQTGQEQLFQTRVAPLLSQRCLECHDTATRKGGLDLSRKENAFAGGDSGPAIVAGNAGESLLWDSVEFDEMPHDRPPLSQQEKSLLKKWIESGAAWTDDFIDPAIYKHPTQGGELWIQRLTVPEYIATVKAATGVDIESEARELLPPDARADGFRNTAYNLTVDLGHVEAYARLAEMIVDKLDVVKFAKRFHSGTKPTDKDMRALVSEMGHWLLRGPLEEHELATYRGISTTVASAGGGYEESVRLILTAMLQSPRFIYRIERHRGDGSTSAVNAYELASRMSYILWGGPPDETLMRDAKSGALYNCDVVERHVRRMLEDPRAVDQSLAFITQFLNLDRLRNLQPDTGKFPNWSPELASDMREETLEFFRDVVWKQQRPLADLLNAQVTYLTPRLARHYALPETVLTAESNDSDGGVESDDSPRRVGVSDVPSRGGLLTQGSVLTIGGDEASMVTRGLFVLHDLLYSEVGDPPPGLDTTPVPASPGRSRRAIATERVESASCGGCHSRFEPLAYGLERFDGLGTYYLVDEHGNDLRQDGQILFPGATEPVAYESTSEMMDLLAKSDRVSESLTRKVIQFALGRPLVPADVPAINRIHQEAQDNGGTYQAIMSSLVMSELVQTTRTVSE